MSWLDTIHLGSPLAWWPILIGAIVNAACAMLGCFLVLRRMSLLGDAISHAILPGLVIAFLLGGKTTLFPMFAGAMVMGMMTALLTHTLHWFGKVPEDSSMGVVFTTLFAIGVLLVANFSARVHIDKNCVLEGAIEFVALDTFDWGGWQVPRALPSVVVALGATLLFVILLWKELKLVSFDPLLATAMGISATVVHYLLMAMVAAVTVAAFEAVGSILVVAMLIVPAATAHLLTDRLLWMMVWSVAIAALSSLLGYLGAAWLDTSVAGMMAVAAGGQFTLAVFLAPRHGLASKAAHNLALAVRIVSEDIVALLYRGEELSSALGGIGWRQCARFAGGGLVAWLALPRLWQRGEVSLAPGWRVRLTQQGRHTAQSLVRAHRLWEAYLGEHFQLPLDHLHEPAERIEHFLGPQLQETLAAALKKPGVDPHGREIPPPAED